MNHLIDLFEQQVSDGPPPRHVGEDVAGGRRRLRRRRLLVGGAATLAAAAVIGGAWALPGPGPTTSPPVATEPTASATVDADAAFLANLPDELDDRHASLVTSMGRNGEIEMMDGASMGDMFLPSGLPSSVVDPRKGGESLAGVLSVGRKTWYVSVWREAPGEALHLIGTATSLVPASVAGLEEYRTWSREQVAPGSKDPDLEQPIETGLGVPRPGIVTMDRSGRLTGAGGVTVLDQRTPSGLPTNFADPARGDRSAVARVREADGAVWWIAVRDLHDSPDLEVMAVDEVTGANLRTLDAFVAWASDQYESGEGLL